MHKNHGTFCRSTGSRVHYGDASDSRPKKLKSEGTFPCFTTDYSEYGRREQPNAVTPGSPVMRLQNRYGERDREPAVTMPFGPIG